LFEALQEASVLLTPHANKPVPIEMSLQVEGISLTAGLFNAGVVAMRRSEMALVISKFMIQRLEQFGHAYRQRRDLGLNASHDFEFVDQIWLNLFPIYFADVTVILNNPIFNLGHWNMHEGSLSIRNHLPYFDEHRVVIAHFSGLPPANSLCSVSTYSSLYRDRPSHAWALIAADYLDRLGRAQAIFKPRVYSYRHLEPKPVFTVKSYLSGIISPLWLFFGVRKILSSLFSILKSRNRLDC
jgi:hypothetical protein